MSYLLLTGATGLLGSYLLRDAYRHELPLAVIVRASRTAGSARQRIEDQMVRWERLAGHAFPRPVVLEGDLTRPQLGLSSDDLTWISENCSAVLHNAASLTFVAKDPAGEPYQSNVGGVRHVLELCRAARIRTFHHVSTAYVCGLRHGRILETELDVGQELGNDYERSKLEAEKLVLEAEHLDSRTIFRPAIITGDSSNGYTSTFHGLYVPLKAAFGLVQALATEDHVDLASLLEAFALNGTEKKNFVPVNWVSAVMMHVVAHEALHQRTYHLAPVERTPVGLLAEVIQQSLLESLARKGKNSNGVGSVSPSMFSDELIEQMDVYRSYWRDDPEFDTGNTRQAAPHLPCPVTDRALLKRMCDYAIRSNFGWPKSPSSHPELDTSELFDPSRRLPRAAELPASGAVRLGLSCSGPGGGDWRIDLNAGRLVAWRQGLSSDCRMVAHLSTQTLGELARGTLSVSDAAALSRLTWEADILPDPQWATAQLEAIFRDVAVESRGSPIHSS